MSGPIATGPLTVEEVSIDLLRPDPANPRWIAQEELDSLERSIRQFGFVAPVLARKEDGTIIGGHQRLVAARRLGLASRDAPGWCSCRSCNPAEVTDPAPRNRAEVKGVGTNVGPTPWNDRGRPREGRAGSADHGRA
jgi:hypothetical protein